MAIERHHYVPQGFLKGFRALGKESDKFIWVYEKLPDRRPRCVSVKSIAWESFYYEQETETGECDSDTLERAFSISFRLPRSARSRRYSTVISADIFSARAVLMS